MFEWAIDILLNLKIEFEEKKEGMIYCFYFILQDDMAVFVLFFLQTR